MHKGLMRKLIIFGLGLVLLAIILSSIQQFIIAGIVFIIIIALGVFGILKMFWSKEQR